MANFRLLLAAVSSVAGEAAAAIGEAATNSVETIAESAETIAESTEAITDAVEELVDTIDTMGTTLSTESPLPVPPTPGPSILPWVILGVVAVVSLIIIALLVSRMRSAENALKRRRAKALAPAPQPVSGIRIGKVHEQGKRSSQQDCFAVSGSELLDTHGVLAVVADGMGGLSDGDKVSKLVAETVMDSFYMLGGTGAPDQVLLYLAQQANLAVNQMLGAANYRSSGSTMVVGLVKNGYFYHLSIGDSIIALLRDGALFQLNREHTYGNELALKTMNTGENISDALSHPKASGLTSFLGMGELKQIDIPAKPIHLRAGDKLILMSDGVSGALTEEELIHAMQGSAETAAANITAAVQDKGYTNQDNFTAIILECTAHAVTSEPIPNASHASESKNVPAVNSSVPHTIDPD